MQDPILRASSSLEWWGEAQSKPQNRAYINGLKLKDLLLWLRLMWRRHGEAGSCCESKLLWNSFCSPSCSQTYNNSSCLFLLSSEITNVCF